MKIAGSVVFTLGLLGCAAPHSPLVSNPVAPLVSAAPRCEAREAPMAELKAATEEHGFPSAACVAKAQAWVAAAPLRAKLGQMLQPDRAHVARDSSLVAQYGLGSLLSGGGSAPSENTALGWAKMVNGFREQSLKSATGMPLLYGIDAVHGHNNVYGAVIFPHNIGLGATRDPALVERVGEITARELMATQIDWTFSPVLATARDERWGRTYEAFGETLELAELLGPALIRGLQGARLGQSDAHVLACAKHFIGDGNTENGKDQGNAPLTLEQIRQNLLPAYTAAIRAGVGSIMVSYSSIADVKMHCHGGLLNDVLKGELGFGGFLVTDFKAIQQLPGSDEDRLAFAINAGVDMLMEPKLEEDVLGKLERLVPSRIPLTRIDDAVSRIVSTKCELGMLNPNHYVRDRSGGLAMRADLLGEFGSKEHRQVAREAVQASAVLLKNEASALPLKPGAGKIQLLGSGADDMGRQAGGWTISWQGQPGPIIPGTTLRQALQQALPGAVSYSDGSQVLSDASTVVVVASETPYAEMQGDDADLELNPRDVEAFAAAKRAGKKVVLVLFSGRPMILTPVLSADAIVAAWLPGSEGDGLADVLTGQVAFRGRLPHSWPRSIAQVPINVGDTPYDPLFKYGYGLTFGTAGVTHELD